MKVALIQMNSGSDKPANLAAAQALIGKDAQRLHPRWFDP
jgi:predicted amidohydrolase